MSTDTNTARTIAAQLAAAVAGHITPLDAGTILAAAVVDGTADGIDIAAAILAYAADGTRELTTWHAEFTATAIAADDDGDDEPDDDGLDAAVSAAAALSPAALVAAASESRELNRDDGPPPRRVHSGAADNCTCPTCTRNRRATYYGPA